MNRIPVSREKGIPLVERKSHSWLTEISFVDLQNHEGPFSNRPLETNPDREVFLEGCCQLREHSCRAEKERPSFFAKENRVRPAITNEKETLRDVFQLLVKGTGDDRRCQGSCFFEEAVATV